ncbi:MAG: hypothetical protein ACRDFC_00480 [Ignavibacteria bacterium]
MIREIFEKINCKFNNNTTHTNTAHKELFLPDLPQAGRVSYCLKDKIKKDICIQLKR